ncbi:hypothetical protein KEM52_001936, partial [Ascosphaera acerosa]
TTQSLFWGTLLVSLAIVGVPYVCPCPAPRHTAADTPYVVVTPDGQRKFVVRRRRSQVAAAAGAGADAEADGVQQVHAQAQTQLPKAGEYDGFESAALRRTRVVTAAASPTEVTGAPTSASIRTPLPLQPRSSPSPPEQSDAELTELLHQWEKANAAPATQSDDRAPPVASAPPTPPTNLTSSNSSPRDISEYALYPREMSCRSAFDYAFFCQSFGGQFVNVYRYGSLRSCSERWSDFWYCMRTNQLPEAERKAAIADHYRRKAVKYKTGPSSQDVWEMRTEPVRTLFQNDYQTAVKDDAAE